MFKTLLSSRRFAPLFLCQFFSAFNDNFLKNALVFLILFRVGGAGAETLVTLAGATFILPFFLLSGLGGEMADRFDKAVVARRLKLVEMLAALLSVAGFWAHSVPALFVALALFGIIAALFGPVKYGILPDHLAREELGAGNALVEGATFLAILLGTVAGGLASTAEGDAIAFGIVVIGFAALCWVSSLFIPSTAQAAPDLRIRANIFASTGTLLRHLYAETRLWRCGLYASWFWLVGAVVLSLLPALVKNIFGGDEAVVTLLLATFSVGIALGSALASWLARGRIVLLPTPVASVLMGLFGVDVGWQAMRVLPAATPLGVADFLTGSASLHVTLDFFGLAVAGGLFIVPAFTAIQAWSREAMRARAIAAVNVLNAAFMVGGAAIVAGLQAVGFHTPALFVILGAASLLASLAIFATLPTSAFRDGLSILFRALYRLEIEGGENIAKAGPNAIVALNHVSFLDAGLALSLLDKDPIFAIDSGIAQRWWVRPFLKLTRALPLDPAKPLATRTLINAVRDGESLVIFPEGRISITGSLMKVYDGAGLIAEKSGAMVLPVRIDGLEQTPFSRLNRMQVRRHWWPKVTATVLPPVRLTVDPALVGKKRRHAAGAALYGVMSDLVFRTTPTDHTVIEALIRAGRTHGWGRDATEDPITGTLTYSRLMTGATVLGRKLGRLAGVGEAVGIMLPNSNAAPVTILGLMSAGRVPAMINFSAGLGAVEAACRAAQVTTIVTARAFVEKAKLDALVAGLSQKGLRFVYLEDVRAGIGLLDKLRGLLGPRRALALRRADDPAVILFTSGSEGTPKGVVLSHRNLLANVAQVAARIDFGRTDKVFNVLPVFHSFGLTGGLVLPLVSGVPVYLYPSPLHFRILPELIYGSNATVLFGTDTFLTGYAKTANPYDFRSLRYVVAGAEPVKEATRRIYMEKFGLRIFEGYGVTETAPVLALNTPMFNRFGTVGRVLPGMDVRLEAVDGVTEGGRLFVRGPNVMLGYLRAEAPGVLDRPAEGWHDTGDIVAIDPDGFVSIKGRAKRFAKVAGEMVSLATVETMAAALWPETPSAAATAPDPRKGERIVLVTEHRGATRADYAAFAKARGAADIALPSEVLVIEKVPLLGTGKIDMMAVQRLVRDRHQAEAA